MDNKHVSIIQHIDPCSMLYGSLDGSGVWGRMDTCICMAESLCYSRKTVTTLLIGYTPIQNKKLKKKKKKVCTKSTQEKLFYLTDSSGNFTKGDI